MVKTRSSAFAACILVLVVLLALTGCRVGTAPTTGVTPSTSTAATRAGQVTATAISDPITTPARAPLPTAAGTNTPAPAPPPAPSPTATVTLCSPAPPFATPPAATPGPPRGQPSPSIPLPRLEADYTLVVDEFRPLDGRLRAAETVRVTNREGCALDRLFFSVTAAQWGWFTLDATRVEGQAVDAAVGGTVLPVRLPRPLAPGESATLSFDFRLDIGDIGGFAGTTRDGDILRLAYWFPILSDDHQYPPLLDPPYTATADFDVTLTLPADLVVAHTGLIVEEGAGADGTITRRIRASNVRDFVLTVSPNYQVVRRLATNGVEIELYYNRRNIDPSGQNPALVESQVVLALDAAILAQERLSELIGQYPYPVLRVVDPGPRLGGGIEFPMLVWANLATQPAGELASLVYHEVAHEWFYGIIGTRTQQDPWIDEGGASFLAAYLGNELRPDPPGPQQFAYRLSASVWEVPAGGAQRPALSAFYLQGEALYTRVFLAMGEEAFWGALRALYRDHQFGIITPRDILSRWQAASPVDLRPLFKDYLDYPWIDDLRR